ncbi:hypothetical protein MLD38_012017 [Melastoma candidum]|uniref:Uncharacterized protein n=1 Tax=Melastoma candidum TaxID=119954 RepID=A0ACB9R4J5_9MYRT|nr:hypothetical protein MLD38_012017 [Melastoma candidum]
MDNPPRRQRRRGDGASLTLPSSPTRSSFSSTSSSDFEFTVVVSPRMSASTLCPADDLFYKGQLLPLHHSSRISMVHTIISDASRPSSVTADLLPTNKAHKRGDSDGHRQGRQGYFGLSKFPAVFLRGEIKQRQRCEATTTPGPVNRMSVTAKEVIGKYLKKVKPIYEKLSSRKQQQQKTAIGIPPGSKNAFDPGNAGKGMHSIMDPLSQSFSGNLRHPRKRTCATSCPSPVHWSPSHSGVLIGGRPGFGTGSSSDGSSMEELRNAIQGAIAHCKNSMSRNCGDRDLGYPENWRLGKTRST